MSPKLMIWASVVLSAVAQLFLKHGLTLMQRKHRMRKSLVSLAVGLLGEKFVWLWAFSFVAATALWLLGLQHLDLSYAYPLVAFGYVLVNILSAIVFRERVDRNRWVAVTVISLGVVLIAGS